MLHSQFVPRSDLAAHENDATLLARGAREANARGVDAAGRSRRVNVCRVREGRSSEISSALFATTEWSLVLSAAGARGADSSAEAQAALSELCERYWYPIYAYVRRWRGAEEARDLTQKFMLGLVEKNTVARADPSRGRFRTWLLASVKNFLHNENDYERAQKRDRKLEVSLDALDAERRYALEPRTSVTPERLYDRAFSLCVLHRAITRLGEDLARDGYTQRFDAVRRFLPGPDLQDSAYAPIADDIGLDVNHFKKLVHDYRARFRRRLDEEIGALVHPDLESAPGPDSPSPAAAQSARDRAELVAEERRFLMQALSLGE